MRASKCACAYRWKRVVAAGIAAVAMSAAPACRRAPAVSDDTYRQAVAAFYVSLAAMQTSQDALARRQLDRLVQLVPGEPAGWANLGLLLLRQQQVDEAAARLAKAAEIAPRDAAIERLVALAASRKGNLDESIRHWRRAIDLDGADLKAPYALALELERLGGAANDAEAQRRLEGLAARSRNLAAQIEFARIAAKRADTAALGKALDALAQQASGWPSDAQERLKAVRDAAQGAAGAAATPVIFLKNVLIREPVYRAALAEVSTPRSEVGEPLVRFVVLRNPDPQPAAADEQLAFAVDSAPRVSVAGASWAGPVWLTGDVRPEIVAAAPRELRSDSGLTIALPAEMSLTDAGPDAIAVADLDYDFRNDLALAGSGGVALFRQTDKATFVNATAESKLPPDVTRAPAYGVWPADVDTDGDLDLVLAPRDRSPIVLRNNGDHTFAVQSPFAAVRRARGFVWADVDGEGVPDAVLLDDSGALRVFLNLRGSQFRERPVPAQFPRVAAIAAIEVNGDGILDVVGVAADGTVARLSQAANGTAFEAATLARIDPPSDLAPGRARLFAADLDNNGAGDLVISTRPSSRILLGGPGGTFRPVGGTTLPADVTAAVDLDGDGRLELVVRTDTGARIVHVKGQKQYRWQAIRPRAVSATGDQRINSFGIGGEVEVRTGLHAQKQIIAAPVVHFGLGDAATAEVARIVWPNGVLQSEFDLAANAVIAASQRLKGSCPWLFAWNGAAMGFVTDFIWRSPLGLRINAQDAADVQTTEDWVRIRGDQLAARNRQYDLRITAELWETHFFDLVSLLMVDHPEGTEAFVDERFTLPAPRLGIVATSPMQEFSAVRDDLGNDVRDVVRARDDRHLDFAGRGRYQGVTREHYVDIELPGNAPRNGPVYLVAQGWVHPTDSSINVALGQGKDAPPAGLSLYVADASGGYTLARGGLGFPAGKDKTILIDLSGLFRSGATRRMRLTTNLEIFWDRLGWAIGRPDVTLEPRKLPLAVADLQYRGFSVTDQKDASTPERPRYEVAGVAPRWRDLEGFHTRFGDVRELLDRVDDRYVIMNAGDELRLAFPEAPPLGAGYVRDFVLVGDGWVKDGDYNTVASRTVLPLPTHRTARYPNGGGKLEDDPVYRRHREDFEHYHTRYVTPDAAGALRDKIDRNRP
jgi:tetratricopeptide (TPR) repeat protein